jgi:DNA-binding CsgD family transcriptional regulator
MRWSTVLVTGSMATEVELLRFLAPHLQRAFRLYVQFCGLKGRSLGSERAFDLLPTATIFLGPKGEIVFMNRSAEALVAERNGLTASSAGLRAECQGESKLLAKTILAACSTSVSNGLSAGGTILVSRRERPPLQILVSPIRNSRIGIRHQAIAAVAFVSDPLRQQRPAQEVLRALYRLTWAECRVALLLSDGHAPRKIANMVGVADSTVRSQIKSIFSKAGVRRQGELIRLLMSNSAITVQAKPAR